MPIFSDLMIVLLLLGQLFSKLHPGGFEASLAGSDSQGHLKARLLGQGTRLRMEVEQSGEEKVSILYQPEKRMLLTRTGSKEWLPTMIESDMSPGLTALLASRKAQGRDKLGEHYKCPEGIELWLKGDQPVQVAKAGARVKVQQARARTAGPKDFEP